jgi:hypothetical protein
MIERNSSLKDLKVDFRFEVKEIGLNSQCLRRLYSLVRSCFTLSASKGLNQISSNASSDMVKFTKHMDLRELKQFFWVKRLCFLCGFYRATIL